MNICIDISVTLCYAIMYTSKAREVRALDKDQIDALLAALKLGLEGDVIEKITVIIKPKPKQKPTK